MSDQYVAEAATYTTHNKQKVRTSIPSEGFEPAIPTSKRRQTYAIDPTTTGIVLCQLFGCSRKALLDGVGVVCVVVFLNICRSLFRLLA